MDKKIGVSVYKDTITLFSKRLIFFELTHAVLSLLNNYFRVQLNQPLNPLKGTSPVFVFRLSF